jgi:hypothetical protein
MKPTGFILDSVENHSYWNLFGQQNPKSGHFLNLNSPKYMIVVILLQNLHFTTLGVIRTSILFLDNHV